MKGKSGTSLRTHTAFPRIYAGNATNAKPKSPQVRCFRTLSFFLSFILTLQTTTVEIEIHSSTPTSIDDAVRSGPSLQMSYLLIARFSSPIGAAATRPTRCGSSFRNTSFEPTQNYRFCIFVEKASPNTDSVQSHHSTVRYDDQGCNILAQLVNI